MVKMYCPECHAEALTETGGALGGKKCWQCRVVMYPQPESFFNVTNGKAEPAKHAHYFKPCPYSHVDVYRVLLIFGVTDPCIQHAVKKLLVAGGRGHKDIDTDIQNAIDTLERWKAMREEESADDRTQGI